MAEPRDWSVYLADMRRCCVKVMINSKGYEKARLLQNELVLDAVLRNLERRRIAGLRDVLAHAYFSLEDDTLWQVISESVPALHRQLNAVNLHPEEFTP